MPTVVFSDHWQHKSSLANHTRSPALPIRPLAFGVYLWTVVFLAAAGLAVSVYLSVSHYLVYTDVAYESFCAITRSINCDTVSQSPYSIFLGLPVPQWGVIGYIVFLALLPFAGMRAAAKKRMWSILFALALLLALCSIVLATVSTFLIHSFCIMCIVSYGINFFLVFYTWLIRRRFSDETLRSGMRNDLRYAAPHRKLLLAAAAALAAALVVWWSAMPVYWYFTPPALAAEIPTGVTADGHPWIGAAKADLVITEFADYMCFQCNKMHYYLRKLMVRYPGKIKLVHRHFPMDEKVNPLLQSPVHVGSGALSILAIHAGRKGRFWQMNDLLFSIAREVDQIDTGTLADAVGLDAADLSQALGDPKNWKHLQDDLTAGFKLGVTGTPTFVIDGRVYHAKIPPEILSRITD